MSVVSLAVADGVATLQIDRPEALNALNAEVLESLAVRLGEIRARADVSVVVLRGTGDRAFAAGADVKAMLPMNGPEGEAFSRLGQRVMRAMTDLAQPVVAAVHGFCLGGGFELALSADTIWAADNAVFGFPEVGLGLLPGFAGTQRFARAVGQVVAKDWILSARKVKAPEALQVGAVARVLPTEGFFEAVQTEAIKMAANGPLGMRYAKSLVLMASETDLENGSRAEASAFGLALGSAEAKEGITALLEKRPAQFKA